MEFLTLVFFLPLVTCAQRYDGTYHFQDEPFLPIFPVYPYSPKLIKRGTEKDVMSQLNSELYPPKPDARDSYSPSFNGNYQRNNQNAYLKTDLVVTPQGSGSASIRQQNSPELFIPAYNQNVNQDYTRPSQDTNPGLNIYSSHYNTNPHAYSSVPNLFYNGYQTILIPQQIAATLYSNYNYQAPFHNSNYRPHHTAFQPQISITQQTQNTFSDVSGNNINTEDKNQNIKKDPELKSEQFLDGNNYLSTNGRDLDGQSTTSYIKIPNGSNQVENLSDLHVRNAQLPGTAYSLINMGQSAPSQYSLSPEYNYQYGQLIDSALVKFLPENTADTYQNQYKMNPMQSIRAQGSNIPVIAKTGLAYVMTPTQFQVSPRHIGKATDNTQVRQSSGNFGKNQKLITPPSIETSQEIHIASTENTKSQNLRQFSDLVNYAHQSNKLYNLVPSIADYKKNVQKYPNSEEYSTMVYPSPQAYTYQYSGYSPGQSHGQPTSSYKTTLEDVNFGVKGGIKNLFMS